MTQRLIVVTFLTLAALPARAAEAQDGLNPFSGDIGNAIWTLTIFVLVVAVLGKFAWGPILGLLQDREEFIHKALVDAKHDRQEAEARLKEYTEKLQAARVEAAAIVEESRRDAERLRGDLRQKAQAEAEGILRNAERRIQQETDRALQQIRHEAVDLSVMIASKIIGKTLTKEDNERLIADALEQVEIRSH